MKRRVSLSIRTDIIRRVDKMVAEGGAKSRTHAIEDLIESSLKQKKYCVIIAGGEPKNLWVNELKAYRPLVPVAPGRTLIEDMVGKVVRVGYTHIFIIGSRPLITEIFNVLKNGEENGCEITYVEEREHGNTANTLAHVMNKISSSFLFLPCDHWFDFNLRKLEDTHKQNEYTATLAIYAGARYEYYKTAMVELDGSQITRYWDTPSTIETHMISTLIGIFEPSIFNLITTGSCSLEKDIFTKLALAGKLGGVVLAGNFVNLHSKSDLDKIRELQKLKKTQR